MLQERHRQNNASYYWTKQMTKQTQGMEVFQVAPMLLGIHHHHRSGVPW